MSLLFRMLPETRSLMEPMLGRFGASGHGYSHPFSRHFPVFPSLMFNPDPFTSSMQQQLRYPLMDVHETEQAYVVSAEVPGVPRNSLNCEVVHGDTLVISGKFIAGADKGASEVAPDNVNVGSDNAAAGSDSITDTDHNQDRASAGEIETTAEKGGKAVLDNATMHTNERVYGSFRRSISFASRIDAAKLKATLKDGVLTVQIPKDADTSESVSICVE
ncbi:hypothetical protein BSLG_008230 [Batrachochytrium salamandrivorans]|nr:hypothetical protein BSLG_008230 [Batrachochytrium salamandrivorans]